MSHLTVFRTAERPDLEMWLFDRVGGSLVDLSTGYTFVFKIGYEGSAAVFTKTTGITGAAGSGTEPTGTPNVVLTFSAAELDSLTKGTYSWQLRCTTGGSDRLWDGKITVRDVIT
jgi:hypothetical protein